MLFKISEALSDVLHGIDQKAWRLDIAGKSFMLRGFATLIAISWGVFLGKSLALTILTMMILTYLIVFLYDYQACKKQLQPDFSCSRSNIAALTKTGIPLALYYIFITLISSYPRVRLEEQYGKKLLGIFSSIAMPTVLVSQLSSLIYNPFMGVFAEARREFNKKRLIKIILALVGVTIMLGVGAIVAGKIVGEWALVLLFGESIKAYAYLLIPIIYTAILTAIIWLFCGLLTVFNDYRILAALTFMSFLVCLITAPYLIAEKQMMGAVQSLSVALVTEALLLSVRLIYILHKERLLP